MTGNIITVQKDDFTGLKTIRTGLIGLKNFKSWSDSEISKIDFHKEGPDFFMLTYGEVENGQGDLVIQILSFYGLNSIERQVANQMRGALRQSMGGMDLGIELTLGKHKESPEWGNVLPLIIDEERITLNSPIPGLRKNNVYTRMYTIPIDVLSKLSNAKIIRYSLRGDSARSEGLLSENYIVLIKAFEQFCFGDEQIAIKLVDEMLSAEKEKARMIEIEAQKKRAEVEARQKAEESKLLHEKKYDNKVVDSLTNKKNSDVLKYFITQLFFPEDILNTRLKKIAEKLRLDGVYKIFNAIFTLKGFLIFLVVMFILSRVYTSCNS